MVKTIFAWVRLSFTIPWAVLGWLWCVCACVFQFADIRKLRFKGTGILVSEWNPWFAKFYPFSMTIGRSMIFYPGAMARVNEHEQRHVNQVEDLMVLSFLVGLVVLFCTGDAFLGFMLWVSGGAWQLPNFLTAMLRYSHLVKWSSTGSFASKLKRFLVDLFVNTAYRGSEHELSAYAQTDLGPDGVSWADRPGNIQ